MSKQNHIFTKIRTGSQAEKLAIRLSARADQKTGTTISTVSELEKAGMGLRVTCTKCASDELFKGRKMKDQFGAATLMKDIRDPCACGSKAVSRMPEAV